MLNQIFDSCNFLLDNYPEAQECRDYINSRLSKNIQEIFPFGYFPDNKNIPALISLVGKDVLYETKLLFKKYIQDSLSPRIINFSYFDNYPLVLPFKDPQGNVVALVGRTLLPEYQYKKLGIPKYKNTSFKKGNYLFGLFENKKYILEQDSVYIVEGQIDVIKSVEKGMKNIVALGCSHMTSYQFSVISRYTTNIFLLLDNDESGQKGRKSIMDKYGKFANICNFYIPEEYKDIDEYISKENISKYEDMLFTID